MAFETEKSIGKARTIYETKGIACGKKPNLLSTSNQSLPAPPVLWKGISDTLAPFLPQFYPHPPPSQASASANTVYPPIGPPNDSIRANFEDMNTAFNTAQDSMQATLVSFQGSQATTGQRLLQQYRLMTDVCTAQSTAEQQLEQQVSIANGTASDLRVVHRSATCREYGPEVASDGVGKDFKRHEGHS